MKLELTKWEYHKFLKDFRDQEELTCKNCYYNINNICQRHITYFQEDEYESPYIENLSIEEVNSGYACEKYISLKKAKFIYNVFIVSNLPISFLLREILLIYVTPEIADPCSLVYFLIHFCFSMYMSIEISERQ